MYSYSPSPSPAPASPPPHLHHLYSAASPGGGGNRDNNNGGGGGGGGSTNGSLGSNGNNNNSNSNNNNNNNNSTGNGGGFGGNGSAGSGGGGNGVPNGPNGPGGGRYSLINKIQHNHNQYGPVLSPTHHHSQQPQHHQQQQQQQQQSHSFSYPGPPSSPAYSSNGPSQSSHHNSLPGQSHHSSHNAGSLNNINNSGPPQALHHPPQSHGGHPLSSHHLSSLSGGVVGGSGSIGSNMSSNNNNNNSNNGGGGHLPPSSSNGGPITAHWQQQLSIANVSRQANSPHHHARAAHLATRGVATSAVAITNPNGPSKVLTYGSGSGSGSGSIAGGGSSSNNNGHHRKETGSLISRPDSTGPDALDNIRTGSAAGNRSGLGKGGMMVVVAAKDTATSPTTSTAEEGDGDGNNKKEKENHWTTIDMGGMSLKNLSVELFRYTFLTTLYIPHNSLTTIPGQISKLCHLVLLDASGNKLTSLPPELGLLTTLRDLYLFDNHLTSLPAELGTLHLLDTLGIEGNPLPETIRSLLEKDGTSALIAYLRDSCPVPLPPPERDWVTVEPDSFPTVTPQVAGQPPPPPDETFSILCYNVLCEKYATAQLYGYTPSWALAWEYRKELILQELMNYSADILCLQEVDIENYEEYFLEHLSQQGYDGVYHPKSRARTMSGEERKHVDGCATFYKNTTFALVEQQQIEFNQIAMRRPDFKKTEDMFNRVMTKDHIAVVCLLEHRASGARLIIANVHVEWNPDFRDVKMVQVAMLMDELNRIGNDFAKLPSRLNLAEGYDKAPTYSNGTKIPTIICGDFNSVPDSGVYEFMTRGEIPKDHPDFMSHVYGTYTSEGLKHRLSLRSAYSHLGELPFTNYTPGFVGAIDHLFYTTNSLGVTGLLGEIDKEYLAGKVVGFPSAHFPSDHIAVLAEFKVKDQKA